MIYNKKGKETEKYWDKVALFWKNICNFALNFFFTLTPYLYTYLRPA